jgi:predicted anti-sigma-YlaC factor YlaD
MDGQIQNFACSNYELLLEDFVNGELSGAGAKSLAEHLKDCGACRAAFQNASECSRLLHLADHTPDPGPGFARTVMARIRTEASPVQEKSLWQPFVFLGWRFAATAALGLVALMTYDISGHIKQSNRQSGDLQIEARDLFSTDSANPPRTQDDVLMLVAESNHGNQ